MSRGAALEKDDPKTGYREGILSKISTVAAIPTASIELVRLLQEPDIPNAKLAQAVEYDPSLTSNLLRLETRVSEEVIAQALEELEGLRDVFRF